MLTVNRDNFIGRSLPSRQTDWQLMNLLFCRQPNSGVTSYTLVLNHQVTFFNEQREKAGQAVCRSGTAGHICLLSAAPNTSLC